MKCSWNLHKGISWSLHEVNMNRKWDIFIRNSWNTVSWIIHEVVNAWKNHEMKHKCVHEEFMKLKLVLLHEEFMQNILENVLHEEFMISFVHKLNVSFSVHLFAMNNSWINFLASSWRMILSIPRIFHEENIIYRHQTYFHIWRSRSHLYTLSQVWIWTKSTEG